MKLRLSGAPTRVLKAVTCAGALLLVTAAATRAEAGPIVLTGGRLYTDGILAFRNIAVDLNGPAFALSGSFLSDFVSFLGTPNPAELAHAPGTAVEFDAFVTLDGEFELAGWFLFQGEVYQTTTGQIALDTGRIPVGPLVTLPFTLAGEVHGCTVTGGPPPSCGAGTQTVDLSFVGSGMVRALFSEAATDPRLLQLDLVRYDIAAVPEPSTLLLLAGGLTALVARARSRGSAG